MRAVFERKVWSECEYGEYEARALRARLREYPRFRRGYRITSSFAKFPLQNSLKYILAHCELGLLKLRSRNENALLISCWLACAV